jgi:trigger factor
MKIRTKKFTAAIVSGAMCVGLAASLTGCGNEDSTAASTTDTTNTESTTDSTSTEAVMLTATEMLSSLDFDISDYVTLCDYKSLDVSTSASDYEATDEGLEAYINNDLQYYPVYTATDKTTVEDGDTVNIDYEGTVDGEVLDSATGTDANITIGERTMLADLEDGLIGATVGETIEITLTFPDTYTEDLAGKEATFKVTVNAIEEESYLTTETLTDDLPDDLKDAGYETKEDYLSDMESQYKSSLEYSYTNALSTELKTTILENSTITIPDGYIDDMVENQIKLIKDYLDESGDMTYAEYIENYYGYEDEEDFKDYLNDMFSDNQKTAFMEYALIKDLDYSMNETEAESMFELYASLYGYESVDDYYEAFGGKDAAMLSYAADYVMDEVVSRYYSSASDASSDTTSTTEDSSLVDAG